MDRLLAPRPKKATAPEPALKLTWWAKKGVWQKVIGKVAQHVQEDEYGECGLVEAKPKKWYFGPDRAAAEVAAHRLTQLWQDLKQLGLETWNENEVYLKAAEAIKSGEYAVEVDPGLFQFLGEDQYVDYVDELNRRHRCIRFIPSNIAVYQTGQKTVGERAVRLAEQSRHAAALAGVAPSIASTRRLHEALETFAAKIREEYSKRSKGGEAARPTEWGQQLAAAVERLKQSHPNVPLSEFGHDAVAKMTRYWTSRPNRKGSSAPIAVNTVKTHVKALRRFLDWLDATDLFDWREPRKVKRATKVAWSQLLTEEERAQQAHGRGVKVWSVDELGVLYRFATQWERLLLLLGLNCAFANAELQSLRLNEIDLENGYLARIRRKKNVYARFKLWPETRQLLEWAVANRRQQTVDCEGNDITAQPDSYALLTSKGQPLYRQTTSGNRSDSIANTWNRLLNRIRKDGRYSDFPKLSFKYLRKTSGDLVRNVSDGEIAGVFMSRADAVKSDDEADIYTNRPFEKVFAAQARVYQMLKPMFAQRPSGPLDGRAKGTGPNIQQRKIEDIQALVARGVSLETVARLTHVSRETVRRWALPGMSGELLPDKPPQEHGASGRRS